MKPVFVTSGFFLTFLSLYLTTVTFFLVIDPSQRPAPLVTGAMSDKPLHS